MCPLTVAWNDEQAPSCKNCPEGAPLGWQGFMFNKAYPSLNRIP